MINLIKKCLFLHRFCITRNKKLFSNSINRKYYNILQIKENSSKEEIKEAYYKLVKLHHPDLKIHNQNVLFNSNNDIQFYEIRNAYEKLLSHLDRKENEKKINHSDYNVDDIIEVILNAGINTNKNNQDNCKKLETDTIFYPLYGIKMDKEDILNLKQIIKRINYKIYKRQKKSDEIRKQNEKINMNANNMNLDYLTLSIRKDEKPISNKLPDKDGTVITPISSIIFLRITKLITITGISIFFIINFGIYMGSAITIYVIYLALT